MLGFKHVTAQTLVEAVQQTLRHHPEIMQNRAETFAAREGIAEAKGAFFPSIDIDGGYGREETESPLTVDLEGSDKTTLNRQEFNVALTQNIFAGGGIVGEVERNIFAFQSLNYKTGGVANDLALNTTEAYLNILLQMKLVRLARSNLFEHRRLLKLIEERSVAGITRMAELDQAKSRVALAKANLISAQSNYEEARIRFKKFVGTWPEHLVEPAPPDTTVFPKTVEEGIQKGLDNHPLMKAATADIREARAQNKVANANFYPRIDAVISAGRNRNLDGLEGRNNDNLAMIRARYNAFRGGSDLANARKTAYQVQQALEIRNNTMVDLKETVRLAYNAWHASAERAVTLASYVINAKKTKQAYFEQFQIGQRSFLDLLNAQNEQNRAEIDYLQARNDEVFARYRILNSIGCLIPFLSGHSNPFKALRFVR
ncbi:TolC family outer membrane protein [Legionella sp. 27cVA30]|nr:MULTISPECIES: TolC family outer membrane protein [Legionella]MCP0914130.1 TolC family outer membrane protein [Legionella sp. 27cVA30]